MESSSSQASSTKLKIKKRILIVGRRGRGKSSIANLLLDGSDWNNTFPVVNTFNSATTDLKVRESNIIKGLSIQDTTGFDDTIDTTKIIAEIRQVVTSLAAIDGILFVLEFGRADEWDKVVFMTYLETILSGADKTMVGVVFTKSPSSYVLSNDVQKYVAEHVSHHNLVFFLEAVIKRCNGQVCFIDNPNPSQQADELVDTSKLRKKSFDNIVDLIQKLDGTFSFEGFFNILKVQYNYWYNYVKENPYKISVSAIGIIGTILIGLAKLK